MDNAPENPAVLRHLALNIMRKDTSKGSLRVKFNRAAWKDDFLAQLLTLGRNAIALPQFGTALALEATTS